MLSAVQYVLVANDIVSMQIIIIHLRSKYWKDWKKNMIGYKIYGPRNIRSASVLHNVEQKERLLCCSSFT